MKKTVLFLEWSSIGRDFEIILPLMYFFEEYLKWDVEVLSIFDMNEIIKTSPDLIIMSNSNGARVNALRSKMIYEAGFLHVTHTSEGLFRESNVTEMVWGHNLKLYEMFTTYWSLQSYNMALKSFPYLKGRCAYTGSIGHDKYSIWQMKSKTRLKQKIVLYIGFDFHTLMEERAKFEERLGRKFTKIMIDHIDIINERLRYCLENNPDVRFVIKPHPGDRDRKPLELKGLLNKKNIFIVDKNTSIFEAIAQSDVILNFQSSTNIEAWLLKKISITLFTKSAIGEKFPFTKGSINAHTNEKLSNYIKEYYQNGYIKKFEEMKTVRDEIIRNYIGFTDGLNHIRFVSLLKPYIDKIERGENESGMWRYSLLERLKWKLLSIVFRFSKNKNLPLLKQWKHIYGYFSKSEVNKTKQKYSTEFAEFYEQNKKEIEKIYHNYYKNWDLPAYRLLPINRKAKEC